MFRKTYAFSSGVSVNGPWAYMSPSALVKSWQGWCHRLIKPSSVTNHNSGQPSAAFYSWTVLWQQTDSKRRWAHRPVPPHGATPVGPSVRLSRTDLLPIGQERRFIRLSCRPYAPPQLLRNRCVTTKTTCLFSPICGKSVFIYSKAKFSLTRRKIQTKNLSFSYHFFFVSGARNINVPSFFPI